MPVTPNGTRFAPFKSHSSLQVVPAMPLMEMSSAVWNESVPMTAGSKASYSCHLLAGCYPLRSSHSPLGPNCGPLHVADCFLQGSISIILRDSYGNEVQPDKELLFASFLSDAGDLEKLGKHQLILDGNDLGFWLNTSGVYDVEISYGRQSLNSLHLLTCALMSSRE